MDWDDILNEGMYEGHNNMDYLHEERLELEQPIISRKENHNAFSVNREYVNSMAFYNKFTALPVNKNAQLTLYKETGRLLEFVDGQEEERMLAINARTGEYLVDNFKRKGYAYKTGFTDEEYRCINRCQDGIILIHNHSHNGRPSGKDLLTYLKEEKIRLSLIACHDGTLYGIYDVRKAFENVYLKTVEKHKMECGDSDVAKKLAMTEIYCTQENLSDRHKIINVKKL